MALILLCSKRLATFWDTEKDQAMEKLRLQVETYLNEATRRAYAAVGRPEATLG